MTACLSSLKLHTTFFRNVTMNCVVVCHYPRINRSRGLLGGVGLGLNLRGQFQLDGIPPQRRSSVP